MAALMPAVPKYLKLPPQEAIEYFKAKLNIPTERWDQLDAEHHDFAYTVAGLTRADLLETMRWLIQHRAIEEGDSFETFLDQFDRLIAKKGWQPKPLPGGPADYTLRIKYETPIRRAYGAGRFEQMSSPAVRASRPYWMWRHGDSPKAPRPVHLSLHNQVFPANSPFWKIAYPPCGYGCKCRAYSVGDRQLRERGLTVGTPPDPLTVAEKGFRRAPGSTPKSERQEIVGEALSRLSVDLREAVTKNLKQEDLF